MDTGRGRESEREKEVLRGGGTQDGRGTLKTIFVIEMDSEETQMTRLGMMLSQSCTRLRLKLAREKGRQKVNEKAHDKSCLISNYGEFKL